MSNPAPPSRRCAPLALVLAAALPLALVPCAPLAADDAPWLADRGTGVPTSLFGTYVRGGEWLIYPFYEYTRTPKYEYHPSELGYPGGTDYLGKTFEHEYLLFLSYGLTDRVAFELEGAVYSRARFQKAKDDPSTVPQRITESGFGDLDMQVRWRWRDETASRSELYSFVELTPPLQKNKKFLGTQDWEGAFGLGFVRGHSWGTLNGRLAIAYDGDDKRLELGEYALEYLKRISDRWRMVATIEGESEEVALIGEAQWFFSPHAMLKLNCGFGLTTQAPDIAPEIGVLFFF